MNTCIKNVLALPVMIAALGLIMIGRVTAQTFTTLHSFTALSNNTNSDGAHPISGLIVTNNILYGTAEHGGVGGNSGTVFRLNTDGTGFTNLHSFTGSGGARPAAGLTLSGNTLYGTAGFGGSFGDGTVFAVNTDGTDFTNLYTFTLRSGPILTNSDGAWPLGGLVLQGSTLYGTAQRGGGLGSGTLFAVNTDGTGFTNLHSCIDSSGDYPSAGLILSNSILYGTAEFGGSSSSQGAVFAINTDGTGFTNLHGFSSRGGTPVSPLTLSGNTLYGTARTGGSSDNGMVFAVNNDGTGFTNLHSFSISGGDGFNPYAGLILSGHTLYGTASQGGSSGYGTLFSINTDGTGFTKLYDFTALSVTNSDGACPAAGLTLSGNTLYGTAPYGGTSGNGTIFSLSFRPQLTITPSGTNVILSWPTNFAGFDYTGYTLQSTTNLVSPVIWNTNSPVPVVVNGLDTVTNPVAGAQQFFRLSQ